MRTAYIFSGLGADERCFYNLNFTSVHAIHVKWITPNKNESIAEYAKRISATLTSPNPILIGLSFGGMLAVEVGKIITTEKIIVISSAKNYTEIPWYYRLAGSLKLHHILPVAILKSANFFSYWFFGVYTIPDKKLLADIFKETDVVFLKWAMGAVVQWNNTFVHHNLSHIHGTNDKVLPYKFVHADRAIVGGGHLMVLNKSTELNILLQELLF